MKKMFFIWIECAGKGTNPVYDIVGAISLIEAKNAILEAEKITGEIKGIIE